MIRRYGLLAAIILMISCSKIEMEDIINNGELKISSVLLDGSQADVVATSRSDSQRSVTNVESFEVGDIICIEHNNNDSSLYYYFQLSAQKIWEALGDARLMAEDIADGDKLRSHFIPGVYDTSNYSWTGEGDYPDIMRDLSVEIVDGGLQIDYSRLLNGKLRVIITTTKSVESVTLNSLIRLSYYTQTDSGMSWAQQYCSATQMEQVSDKIYDILLVDLPQQNIPVEVVADGISLVANTGDIEVEQGKVALLYLTAN